MTVEFLTAVLLKIEFFRNVTPCRYLSTFQRVVVPSFECQAVQELWTTRRLRSKH